MPPRKSIKSETTPATMLRRDLDALRRDFRATVKAYSAQVEATLDRLIVRIKTAELERSISEESKYPEMRDASAAIRKLCLKPLKGRRKDLKKIDLLVSDLDDLMNGW